MQNVATEGSAETTIQAIKGPKRTTCPRKRAFSKNFADVSSDRV
jgi:hypothetical protein